MFFLIALAIAAIINVAAYAIMPKPKAPKPEAVEQGETPTAEAGKAIAAIWGEVTVSEVNVLGVWDKSTHDYEVSV